MEVFSIEIILTGFLIFVRVSALVGSAPYFGNASIPVRVKALTAIALTIILYPVVPLQGAAIPMDAKSLEVVIAIFKEVLVGVAMGLTGQVIFAALQMGGELMSINIGLAFASVVDPVSQNQGSIIGQLFMLLGIFIFLGIGGDIYYIRALAESFSIVPVGVVAAHQATPVFIHMATYLFIISIQMAAPFIIVLFMLDLSFAIFARIMPQANIFFIALPLKIGIGFLLLLLILPYTPMAFESFFNRIWGFLDQILRAISN